MLSGHFVKAPPSCVAPAARSYGLRAQAIALVLVFVAGSAATGETAAVMENRRCLNCHGQRHIAEMAPDDRQAMVVSRPEAGRPVTTTQAAPEEPAPAKRPTLYVPAAELTESVHAQLACVRCHPDAEKLPHAQRLARVNCAAQCHSKADADYLRGIHAEAAARGDSEAPGCPTCHGTHGIRPKHDRRSLTHPLNIIKVCGDCHKQHRTPTPGGHEGKEYVEAYLDSVHGRAVSQAGLVVAATCVDCHGSHEILPSNNTYSTVYREHVPQTCGRCHAGIAEVFQTSIHGQRLAEGSARAPVCTDCHTAHGITRASTPGFMRDIVEECGDCHDDPALSGGRRTSFYKTYRKSYHGQVTALGYMRAARCSDCHGAHDIRPIADKASRLHGDSRIATCKRCHEGANAQFVKFDPHADYRDGKRYPLLHAVWLYFVIVMSCSFGFFGLHSLLWFVRSAIERIRHGPCPRFDANPRAIKRFSGFDRINHLFVIITFFGLTLTGLPLLFSDHEWAKALVSLLGGGNVAGILHRIFAVMLLVNFAAHFLGLFRRTRQVERSVVRDWLFGPNTMLPRRKDVEDCLGMFRWFFRGGRKPDFDRWTYWEKFDYAAEVFGSLVIGGSGLLLWFPTVFSAFLPGWVFNVAMIIHGYEALLAVGFIFTIHFFNAHLRLEKFPVDDVIFTGRLPEDEFKHERRVEYARLVERGELDALRVEPAPRWQRRAAIAIGVVAMAIGMTMVVLIIVAGLRAL